MKSIKPDKQSDVKPEPHTEKSTIDSPQEEFIEQQSVPSRSATSPGQNPKRLKRRPGQKSANK